jgi:DNA-binding response OmpR family regulator
MRVAIVEDEPLIAQLISDEMAAEGWHPHIFANGADFIKALTRETFDFILLDWSMPRLGGFETLLEIRKGLAPTTPVMFLTTNTNEQDVIDALNHGADDYCNKPINSQILKARMNRIIRRRLPTQANESNEMIIGDYTFDETRNLVKYQDQIIDLSDKEFCLATLFFKNQDQPFSREHLIEAVWGSFNNDFSRSLDVHISWIRRKLKLNQTSDFQLKPIYGFGYRLIRNKPLTTSRTNHEK